MLKMFQKLQTFSCHTHVIVLDQVPVVGAVSMLRLALAQHLVSTTLHGHNCMVRWRTSHAWTCTLAPVYSTVRFCYLFAAAQRLHNAQRALVPNSAGHCSGRASAAGAPDTGPLRSGGV